MSFFFFKEFSILEIHYWLKNEMHSMDAYVQNKCEHEFLKLLKEIAYSFDVDVIIETEPLALGGLKRRYKVIPKDEGKKGVIKTAVITAVLTGILATPITSSLSKITEKLIDRIISNESEKQKEEKDKLEIIKLKQEIELNNSRLQENYNIEKSRANFYKQLEKDTTVERVSFTGFNEKGEMIDNEIFVNRDDFKRYKVLNITFLVTEKAFFEPIDRFKSIEENKSIVKLENENIEITSPNFTISDEWKGRYNGSPISFKMKSEEFNDLVQKAKIEFKKGTVINCQISKIQNNVSGDFNYDVERVNYYCNDGVKIETIEGRLFRSKE